MTKLRRKVTEIWDAQMRKENWSGKTIAQRSVLVHPPCKGRSNNDTSRANKYTFWGHPGFPCVVRSPSHGNPRNREHAAKTRSPRKSPATRILGNTIVVVGHGRVTSKPASSLGIRSFRRQGQPVEMRQHSVHDWGKLESNGANFGRICPACCCPPSDVPPS